MPTATETNLADLKASASSLSGASKTTEEILAERGKVYGDFTDHARITQELKHIAVVHGVNQYKQSKLSHVQREALDMILHKIGRILNGDPNHRDSWDDIAGYARLAADRCKGGN